MSFRDPPTQMMRDISPEFREMVDRARAEHCPFCGDKIDAESFSGYDPIYYREYTISGLCPECQDTFFKVAQEEL